ncbi:MAG: YtxH domain-containing protein [Bacteroidales bacterium]|nr:YtxH domain-containing protein [Bacteroidales bacterium]
METTDKTILEMQEQMKELREKLESQKIVSNALLRKSFRQNASRLKTKANVPIIFGVAAILLAPSYLNIGASWISVGFTWVLMLICIVATIICNSHIPRMDSDLVTAAEDLTKFKKFHAEWLKFAIPAIILWLGILIWDMLRGEQMSHAETIGLFAGLAVGVTLGLIIGLKMRRDQLDSADDLLDQIEELKAENN